MSFEILAHFGMLMCYDFKNFSFGVLEGAK